METISVLRAGSSRTVLQHASFRYRDRQVVNFRTRLDKLTNGVLVYRLATEICVSARYERGLAKVSDRCDMLRDELNLTHLLQQIRGTKKAID